MYNICSVLSLNDNIVLQNNFLNVHFWGSFIANQKAPDENWKAFSENQNITFEGYLWRIVTWFLYVHIWSSLWCVSMGNSAVVTWSCSNVLRSRGGGEGVCNHHGETTAGSHSTSHTGKVCINSSAVWMHVSIRSWQDKPGLPFELMTT